MKLSDLTKDAEPLIYILLEKQMQKGPVYTWIQMSSKHDIKGRITDIDLTPAWHYNDRMQQVARLIMVVDVEGVEEVNAVDHQIYDESDWDKIVLTNDYAKGDANPGEWWLIDKSEEAK
jgi:hypothetical protein